jgi:glycosyltransferase involved in cell wall biosynthesis
LAHKPDVVHLNAITLAPLALAAKRAGSKVSMMIQETGVRGMVGFRTAWLRWIVSHRVDLVAFISRYDREWYAPSTPAVEVVPNWVDERAFGDPVPREEARSQLGIRLGARVILFVGGVAELKGTVVLLEAMRKLQELEGVELIMAGPRRMVDPRRLRFFQRTLRSCRRIAGLDYDSRVAVLLSDGRLRRRIRYVGEVDNMARLYCAADVVVFPATKPHQARPAIEAGVAGVPVIASEFPNYGEFLRQGDNAVLVPPGNSEALADAIKKILCNEELGKRLARANAAHVASVHDRKLNCDRMVDGILSLVRSGRRDLPGDDCTLRHEL